jgi:type IV secretion system protein VirB9
MLQRRPIAALTMALVFSAGAAAVASPRIASDGTLQYEFGSKPQPTVACRPLFVCDVVLEQGESIINLAIGDSVRWVIASAQSGPGGSTPHVFVKPTQTGLSTNLVITTSKRVYYVRLLSSSNASTPSISFSYPEEAVAAEAARIAADQERLEEQASELPLLPPDKLDYNYKIVGAHEIIPQRTYNDGVHTFIEYATLPTDLPVLYAVTTDGTEQIVNFRLRDRVFIIDGIQSGFDLVLNAGTGKHDKAERRVYIRHN